MRKNLVEKRSMSIITLPETSEDGKSWEPGPSWRNHLSSDEKELLIKLNGNSYEFSCIFLPKTLALLARKGYVRIEERGSRVYSTLRSFVAVLTDAGQARVDNFEFEKKMELVKVAIGDWTKGELSDAAAMYAISLVVLPQPEISEERGGGFVDLLKKKVGNEKEETFNAWLRHLQH